MMEVGQSVGDCQCLTDDDIANAEVAAMIDEYLFKSTYDPHSPAGRAESISDVTSAFSPYRHR